ncbi:HD-GYP domain-containing protein [Enterovirga aerilata]|uniref:HD domain-containing protein n=1 Tax=Enterovirga aerilata TaxID=2730920 RepID=A0A849I5Y9_9HYPH|nr:HD domain-containing phosphohydrolase [Enterovirga sp. DB1703]NNM71745.1 HD domain-containing protein [Enterovirga sp. DB1703]
MIAAEAQDRTRILLLVFERPEASQGLARLLANIAMVRAVHVSELERHRAVPAVAVVCDFNVNSGRSFRAVQAELARPEYRHVPRMVVMDKGKALGIVEAGALGVTGTISRPFDAEAILGRFRSLFASSFERDIAELDGPLRSGVSSAHSVVAKMFERLPAGDRITLDDIAVQEEPTIEALREASLRGWLDAVRRHHSQSYRHCLSVTGVAVSFAQHLGMSHADQRRVARAAIMHDVGKTHLPLTILDKPGSLTEDEIALVREHPRLGFRSLIETGEQFARDTLQVVLHHHEMLDGSGYPHGLAGREIPDLVRIVTVADVFSAMIEDRPYRRPMSRAKAYEALLGMEGRLDPDLVQAFRPVALHN